MKNLKLEWRTDCYRVNDLVPQEVNPRTITDKQMSDLKRSLKKYNLVEIPAVDTDGTILAGHQRIKALQLLGRGEELIDVRVPNRKLTVEESKEYLIASNKLGGDWDFELLKSFDFDTLEFAGFDGLELANIFDREKEVAEEDFDVEKELKNIKEPTTKLGDLIILGKHRVLCGDSTDKENLKKLLGKDKASMIYSDPIYNIGIDYDKGISKKKGYGGKVNDNQKEGDYKNLIRQSLENALSVSKNDLHIFYWSDQRYIWLMQTLYQELGIANKRVCLWIKNGHNPTPTSAFNKCYEPCTYGTRGSPFLSDLRQDLNEVMNKEVTSGNDMLDEIGDIWAVKRLGAKEYEHATSKPPELHEKAIKRCTRPNDIILDSFLGSGSTLIAGEILKRRVYGCELEPKFCDLIVRRWEKLTGEKALYEKDKGTSE